MNRLLPVSLVAAVTALLFHIAIAQASVEKVFRCPCTFSVSRTRNKSSSTEQETFDVLISRTASRKLQTSITDRKLSTFSRRRLSVRDATHSDALFHHFHHLKIPETGFFRVTVVHNSVRDIDSPRYLLQLRPTSRQYVCPIMIDADMPSPGYASHYPERLLKRQVIQDRDPRLERETRSRREFHENPTFYQHIVGGLFVGKGLMPYLVNIYNPSLLTVCTGTLLSARWVITAAHCDLGTGSDVYIMSTQIHFSGVNEGRPIGVKRVLRHPNYEIGTTGADPHDIALLELKQSVERFNVSYMPINFKASVVSEGAYARLAGYGRISSDESIPDLAPLALRQVDVPITNFKECRRMYRHRLSVVINLSRKHHFCAGYMGDGGCDGCLGDSGGAVIMYYDQQPVLVGVISGGVSCGELGIPGVNINIASHKDWLVSSGADFTEFESELHPVRSHCEKGEKLVTRNGKTARCKKCPTDSMSEGGATLKCKKCAESMARDPADGGSCSCSGLRGRGFRKNGRCERCPKGSYSRVGDERCRKCPAGSFSAGEGSERCRRCDGAERGATSCGNSSL